MKKNKTLKFPILVPALTILLGVPALSAAAQIAGKISNDSTHQPLAGQEVELISPQGGMAVVGHATTDAAGRFALSGGQIDSARFYLLQTTYQGVDYHAPVKFDPAGKALANLTVYESTRQKPALRIRSARLIVRAEGSQARVQELFALINPLQRAYVNSRGTFFFHLPAQVENPTVAVVGLMNMPLPQTAEKGSSPGDYHIAYALKPGMTVIMVAYNSNYSDNKLTLASRVPYPINRAELFVSPPDLNVNSSLFSPAGKDAESGSQRLEAANLAAGAKLAAEIRGQAAAGASEGTGDNPAESGRSTVKVVPDSVSAVGIPLLLCFLLVLLWALGIRVAKEYPRWKARQAGSPVRKKFQAKMETLLNSIADLDELFASGKMPEKQYWQERLELKAKATAILKKGPAAKTHPLPARKRRR